MVTGYMYICICTLHYVLIAVDLLVDLRISSAVSSTAHLCGVVWCGAVTWALYASQHTPQPAVTSLHSHVITHIPPLLKQPLSSHSPLTTSLLSPPSLLILHTLTHSPNSQSPLPLPLTPRTPTRPSHSHSPLPLPITPSTPTHPSHSHSPLPLPITPLTPTHPTHSHSPLPLPLTPPTPNHPSHFHSLLPLPLTPPTPTHPSHSQSPLPLPLTPPTPTHPTPCSPPPTPGWWWWPNSPSPPLPRVPPGPCSGR